MLTKVTDNDTAKAVNTNSEMEMATDVRMTVRDGHMMARDAVDREVVASRTAVDQEAVVSSTAAHVPITVAHVLRVAVAATEESHEAVVSSTAADMRLRLTSSL